MVVSIIYIYFAICFLILSYTFGFIFYQWQYEKRERKQIQKYIELFLENTDTSTENFQLDQKHIDKLRNKLKSVNKLIAFEKTLEKLSTNEKFPVYLNQLEGVMKSLVVDYQSKSQMEQAYLARFIASHAAQGKWHDPFIYKTLVSYLDDATIYLRENVLHATYQQPDSKWIIQVFKYLSEKQLFHHSKLIQDGLLSYPYNKELLAKELWDHWQEYDESILLGLIGFITFTSGRYKDTFRELLQKDQLHLEVKIRLIRYFKRHVNPKVEPLLLSYLKDEQYEVRTVAVQTLSSYRSDEVILALKQALTDSNFYVRKNASISLLDLGISENELSDILTGQDRYAKDMLLYHLNQKGGNQYELNS